MSFVIVLHVYLNFDTVVKPNMFFTFVVLCGGIGRGVGVAEER